MLKLEQSPTFTGSVDIHLPNGDVAKVECVFKWMSTKDLRVFLQKAMLASKSGLPGMRLVQWVIRGLGHLPGLKKWADDRTITYQTDFDYLDRIVESWSGVDMPWSREACEALTRNYPQAVSLILGAWAKGLAEGRRGNS